MGAEGLVVANCVNMAMRMAFSTVFMVRYFGDALRQDEKGKTGEAEGEEPGQGRQKERRRTADNLDWRAWTPSFATVVVFVVGGIVCRRSEDVWTEQVMLGQSVGGRKGDLLETGKHFAVGAVAGLIGLATMCVVTLSPLTTFRHALLTCCSCSQLCLTPNGDPPGASNSTRSAEGGVNGSFVRLTLLASPLAATPPRLRSHRPYRHSISRDERRLKDVGGTGDRLKRVERTLANPGDSHCVFLRPPLSPTDCSEVLESAKTAPAAADTGVVPFSPPLLPPTPVPTKVRLPTRMLSAGFLCGSNRSKLRQTL